MSKNVKKQMADSLGRVRKIGQREEQLDRRLTDKELDEYKDQFIALADQREELERKKAEVMASYGSQFKTIDLQSDELRRKINSRRITESILVEEWLTDRNEVIRVRADLQEVIGNPRTARPSELQESLPLDQATPEEAGDVDPQEDAPEDAPEWDEEAFADKAH